MEFTFRIALVYRERILDFRKSNNSCVLINFKCLFSWELSENCPKSSGFGNLWNIKNSDVYANFENSRVYEHVIASSVGFIWYKLLCSKVFLDE
jgi:hypothetical protein